MIATAIWIPTPAKSAADPPVLERCPGRFSSSICALKITACEDFHKQPEWAFPNRGRTVFDARNSKNQAELSGYLIRSSSVTSLLTERLPIDKLGVSQRVRTTRPPTVDRRVNRSKWTTASFCRCCAQHQPSPSPRRPFPTMKNRSQQSDTSPMTRARRS